jgi:hypothetical protein
MTTKEFKKHQENCPICFWWLAIWRCDVGAQYLEDKKVKSHDKSA